MLIIYVNSLLKRRCVGEGRELLPTSAWQQFLVILSTLAVAPRVLLCNTGIKRFQIRPSMGIYKLLPDT
jgi:hypothetical protein